MYDLNYLVSVTENDALLIAQLVDEFIYTMETDVSEMEKAIVQNNFKSIHQLAHRMKGSTSILGAVKLQNIAVQLESMAHKKSGKNYYEQWEKLSEEFTQVVCALRKKYPKVKGVYE
ncbi:hypothetical protein CI610_03013 [invertebrate metagenome]|uniref:HPt domain-containing protein n=1 Tax=invertebrate metagenome TaxID=1711999 RepID=A0A2H9T4B5_9ZZZZ